MADEIHAINRRAEFESEQGFSIQGSGQLKRRDKVHAIQQLSPMPTIQSAATRGIDSTISAAAKSKRSSIAELTAPRQKQTLYTRTNEYTVKPRQVETQVAKGLEELNRLKESVNSKGADLSNLMQQMPAANLSADKKKVLREALLDKLPTLANEAAKTDDLNTEAQFKALQKELQRDPLKGVDDVVERFDGAIKRLITLNEDRANEIYRTLDLHTKQIERMTAFQQKINVALAQNSNGAIDWSNNAEMQKFTDEMRLIGVEIPQGYNWDEKQVSLIKSNLDMLKSNKMNVTKMTQTDMSEVSERLKNLYMMRSALWKIFFDAISFIINNMAK